MIHGIFKLSITGYYKYYYTFYSICSYTNIHTVTCLHVFYSTLLSGDTFGFTKKINGFFLFIDILIIDSLIFVVEPLASEISIKYQAHKKWETKSFKVFTLYFWSRYVQQPNNENLHIIGLLQVSMTRGDSQEVELKEEVSCLN